MPALLPVPLLLMLLLGACATTRHVDAPGAAEPGLAAASEPAAVAAALDAFEQHGCGTAVPRSDADRNNTVFVHPGLLMLGIDWGGQRAVDTAKRMVRDGYAGRLLEIRSRQGEPVHRRMLEDEGSRFLGIHYSMGGAPETLARVLEATARAGRERHAALRYSPLMIEPFGFERLHEHVDLDSPLLGRLVVMVSSASSLLRPDIDGAPPSVLNHPRLHIVRAEDFGLNWNHFSVLTDLREADGSDEPRHRRAIELFHTVMEALGGELDDAEIDGRLARLKLRYALADGRMVDPAWLRQLQTAACTDDRTVAQGAAPARRQQ